MVDIVLENCTMWQYNVCIITNNIQFNFFYLLGSQILIISTGLVTQVQLKMKGKKNGAAFSIILSIFTDMLAIRSLLNVFMALEREWIIQGCIKFNELGL